MAFGGLKGTLTGNANSITNPFAATGSVAVVVGDLVYAVLGQQTALTVTACSDNLGNTYTATQVGLDAGTSTGRAFRSRVTVAGTLTSVSATTTASANDVAFLAAVIEGPFELVPQDANPTNISTDITSPFTCPATGVLGQDREVVIAWGAAASGTAWAATSPNLLAGNVANATNIKVAIGYQAVTATTAVTPAFTAAANPGSCVLGTTSFRRQRAAIDTGSNLALSSEAPALAFTGHLTITPAGANLALSSSAPTVGLSVHVTIAPPHGNVALSTVAPDALVNVHETITPASGNVALSASAPTVAIATNDVRQPPAAQLLLNNWVLDETGDPVLDENDDPVLDAAANTPAIIQANHLQFSPAAGSLALSTDPPTIFPKTPANADLQISTAAPTVQRSLSSVIAPESGHLIINLTVITDDNGVPLTDEDGNYITTEEDQSAPTVMAGLAVPAADLLLSSSAPTVSAETTVSFSPRSGQLQLNNWILDETEDPILDESSDPVLDNAANEPIVEQTFAASVLPAAGNLTLSPAAPTVAAGGSDSVVPPVADLVLSSAAPTVAQTDHRTITPVAGDLHLDSFEKEPSVEQTVLVERFPAAANLAFSSAAPGVQSGQSLSIVPSQTDLALSSAAPSVSASTDGSITPAAADLVVSSTAPTAVQTFNSVISPAAAQLEISSAATQVQAGGTVSIVPNFADLAISGTAPTVAANDNRSIAPAQTDLALSGFAPTVVQGANVTTPAAGALVLTSAAPTLSLTRRRSARGSRRNPTPARRPSSASSGIRNNRATGTRNN